MIVVAIVLALVGIVLVVGGISMLLDSFDAADVAVSLIAILFGGSIFVISFVVGGEAEDYYNKERENINYCAEKGGVVNDDGLCLVGGKPIKYENGEWTNE